MQSLRGGKEGVAVELGRWPWGAAAAHENDGPNVARIKIELPHVGARHHRVCPRVALLLHCSARKQRAGGGHPPGAAVLIGLQQGAGSVRATSSAVLRRSKAFKSERMYLGHLSFQRLVHAPLTLNDSCRDSN